MDFRQLTLDDVFKKINDCNRYKEIRLKYFLLGVLLIFLISTCNNLNNTKEKKIKKTSILVEELKQKLNKNKMLNIIDVRSEKEFYGKLGHIEGSLLIPLQKITNSITELKKINDTIYVVCLSGKRSAMAAKLLRSNGMDAVNVKGGMMAWNAFD